MPCIFVVYKESIRYKESFIQGFQSLLAVEGGWGRKQVEDATRLRFSHFKFVPHIRSALVMQNSRHRYFSFGVVVGGGTDGKLLSRFLVVVCL